MNETTAITYKCIKCQQPITGHQSYWFSVSGGPYCSHCIPKPQWPNHTVRLWVAPTITGRLWIFTEQPTVRGELSWLNDGDRYPWTEALFGIPPVMTWDDDPVEIEVSWRVVR